VGSYVRRGVKGSRIKGIMYACEWRDEKFEWKW